MKTITITAGRQPRRLHLVETTKPAPVFATVTLSDEANRLFAEVIALGRRLERAGSGTYVTAPSLEAAAKTAGELELASRALAKVLRR